MSAAWQPGHLTRLPANVAGAFTCLAHWGQATRIGAAAASPGAVAPRTDAVPVAAPSRGAEEPAAATAAGMAMTPRHAGHPTRLPERASGA